jgi:class 3 adenylate cyclase/tRNA A-37 threonylcarbamoyl transferase component Bud32
VPQQGKEDSAAVAKPPTGEVTFFFTDIQGSTSMWERDAKRMQSALARHDELLKGAVEGHGGFVFKMVGDACCAAFASAGDALEAALAAQRAIFEEPWDDRVRVRVRMALHTGAAEERDGDYFGPPLNRVARLLSAGHGGQTLVSHVTRGKFVEDRPEDVELRDMGEHRLRDLKDPERIFQLSVPDLPSEFPPLKTLEAPTEDDRYRLIRQIGSGGMAEVYLAYDEVLEREVAFKVLDRKHAESREAVERFRREARSAASLSHPNIAAIFDRGHTEDGTYYIVMEYVEGGTLEDLIQQEGPLSPERTTEVALQVAEALRVAHEKGVIHRDIKPQNILLSKTGEAKVADFGIARAQAATTMTQAGSVIGSVHYISPEQALGEPATPKSDLYSLGVVLYEMLTGELPYDAETPGAVVMQHVGGLSRSPKEVNPRVPEELDAVTARLLSKDPDDRYADATALVEDLERVKSGLAPVAETMQARTRVGRTDRLRRRGVLVALALLVVSVGAVAAVALNRVSQSAANAPIRTLPASQGASLKPGKYRTDEFRPSFSFRVGKGWATDTPETSDYLPLAWEGGGGMAFHKVEKVYKPTETGTPKLVEVPKDLAGWLQNHPYIETTKPEPITVGGVKGEQFDVVAKGVPEDHHSLCGTDCVDMFQVGTGNVAHFAGNVALFEGEKLHSIVLEDVEGETVYIDYGPDDPKAQKVVESVKWVGS